MISPNNPRVSINIPRQRRTPPQLNTLLHLRADRAADAMRRLSHGLPARLDRVLALEAALASRWPAVYAADAMEWLVVDAAAIHNSDTDPRPECPYCSPDGREPAGAAIDSGRDQDAA